MKSRRYAYEGVNLRMGSTPSVESRNAHIEEVFTWKNEVVKDKSIMKPASTVADRYIRRHLWINSLGLSSSLVGLGYFIALGNLSSILISIVVVLAFLDMLTTVLIDKKTSYGRSKPKA